MTMVREETNQRSYFWYSIAVGIFVGLLFGFAGSSIVSTVKLHEAQLREKNQASYDLMPSQIQHGGLGQAPHFTDLINQNGQHVSSDVLSGKVQIVTFLDPYGVHSSPVLVSNLMNLYEDLKQSHLLGSKVVFVSYNVNPRHAGPKIMARFMKSVAGLDKNDAKNWQFLTGSEGSIGRIVAGRFAVHYRALDKTAYMRYVQHMKELGRFDYAEAINPVVQDAAAHKTIVGHDELVLVSPTGTIKLEITQASAFPTNQILYDVVSMLNLPGMGKSH